MEVDVEVLLLLSRLQRLNSAILRELDEVRKILEEVRGYGDLCSS